MKKITLLSLTVILTLLAAGWAAAKAPHGMHDDAGGYCQGMDRKEDAFPAGPGLGKGIGGITLKKLMRMDLSDAQKKKVANILAANRDDSRKMADQLAQEQQAFIEMMQSEKPHDEAAIRQSFKQMSATMENLVVQKIKIMEELKPVLEKDQLKKLTAHGMKQSDKKDKIKQMTKHRDEKRAMLDTWISTYADTAASKQ